MSSLFQLEHYVPWNLHMLFIHTNLSIALIDGFRLGYQANELFIVQCQFFFLLF